MEVDGVRALGGQVLNGRDHVAGGAGDAGGQQPGAGITGTAGDVIAAIENLAAQGADTVYFHLYGRDDVEHIRLLGSEVVSRF